MIAIVEPGPVIELAVRAHAPGNWLIGVAPVMPVVTVQVREAMAEVPKRQKETDVMPVENTEDYKSRDETHQLEHSPKRVARVLAFQLLEDSLGILAKETDKCVFQRMLGFTVMVRESHRFRNLTSGRTTWRRRAEEVFRENRVEKLIPRWA